MRFTSHVHCRVNAFIEPKRPRLFATCISSNLLYENSLINRIPLESCCYRKITTKTLNSVLLSFIHSATQGLLHQYYDYISESTILWRLFVTPQAMENKLTDTINENHTDENGLSAELLVHFLWPPVMNKKEDFHSELKCKTNVNVLPLNEVQFTTFISGIIT